MIAAIIVSIFVLISPFLAFEIMKKKISMFNNNIMSFRESMDLANLPVITFLVGERKMNFLLDTGATISVIDVNSISSSEYINTNQASNVYGIEGNIQTVPLVEIELLYKNKGYKDCFQLMDMSGAFSKMKEETGVTIHGIIGSNFFKKYRYIINFSELIAYSLK